MWGVPINSCELGQNPTSQCWRGCAGGWGPAVGTEAQGKHLYGQRNGEGGTHSSLLVPTCSHRMDLSRWLFLSGKDADPVPTGKPRHILQLLKTEFYWAHAGPSPVQIPCTAPTQGPLFQTSLRNTSIPSVRQCGLSFCMVLLLLHSFIGY